MHASFSSRYTPHRRCEVGACRAIFERCWLHTQRNKRRFLRACERQGRWDQCWLRLWEESDRLDPPPRAFSHLGPALRASLCDLRLWKRMGDGSLGLEIWRGGFGRRVFDECLISSVSSPLLCLFGGEMWEMLLFSWWSFRCLWPFCYSFLFLFLFSFFFFYIAFVPKFVWIFIFIPKFFLKKNS